MNSMMMIRYSRFAAALLSGFALVACNAVTDVRSSPTYAQPPQNVVVSGTVTGVGLSNTRPIVLVDTGEARCPPPGSPTTYTGPLVNCTYSIQGTTVLRFGSLPIGAPYNIQVLKQPFDRVCTISNGTGVANATVTNVVLNCARSPTTAVPLYTVTATIDPSLSGTPPAGFKITLTTEEGVETISPTAGQSQVVFTTPVFNSLTQLPPFSYTVTATTQQPSGPVNNCSVVSVSGGGANGTNVATAGITPPSSNVTVNVKTCQFTIGGTVGYSPPPQVAYTPQTITGLQLGLRSAATDTVVDSVTIPAFMPATATTTTAFTFPTAQNNNSQGLYEVMVTAQPTGQFCVVDGGGLAPLVVLPAWINGTISNPASAPANITTMKVNCRNLPATANQLTGTYQVVGQNSTITTVAATTTAVATSMGTLNPGALGFGTTQTTGISSTSAGTATTTTVSDDRRFLTFFANGTFMYGVHSGSANTTSGVEHGFYSYDVSDPTNKKIYFTIRTDTNGVPPAFVSPTSVAYGISGGPGLCTTTTTPACTTSTPVMINVVKTPGTRNALTGTFGSGTQGVVGTNREDWSLLEPVQTPAQLTGAWVSTDSKRVWIYSEAGFSPGLHMGVNGAANLQDACFLVQDPTLSSSFWTRRGGDVGCTPGGVAQRDASGNPVLTATGTAVIVGGPAGTLDLPYSQLVPTVANSVLQTAASTTVLGSTILPGFNGRIPGSATNQFVVPSPTYFTVNPGTPETLTIQGTLNDVPVGAPLTFTRSVVN